MNIIGNRYSRTQNPVGNPRLSQITILKAEGEYADYCDEYYDYYD